MTKHEIDKWMLAQFEFEYCPECGGDAEDHIATIGPFGLPFAMCKFSPLANGVIFRHGQILAEGSKP